jgi:hypothetical protein
MPTAQERLEIVRQLLDAETRFEQQGGFVETEMGYHPPSTLSNVIWERCRPMHATLGLSVFVGTEGKRLGTMPKGARAEVDNSDQIWIIFGCPMPIVLRPIPGKQGRFTHVGPIVLPGLMHGEAFAGPASSSGQYWKDWEDNVRGTSIELE